MELARSPGHPFYERLNRVLAEADFDAFVERECARFYSQSNGRPSIPPGVYVRMLLVGYFEGLESEREIDGAVRTRCRCAPSSATSSHSGLRTTRRCAGSVSASISRRTARSSPSC
jgi:hypothetical protein